MNDSNSTKKTQYENPRFHPIPSVNHRWSSQANYQSPHAMSTGLENLRCAVSCNGFAYLSRNMIIRTPIFWFSVYGARPFFILSPWSRQAVQEVLRSTHFVMKQSRQVHIDEGALSLFSKKLLTRELDPPYWDCYYHYCGATEDTVAYLLVLDTLNFCFWTLPGGKRWEREFHSKKVSGYYGLAAALKQALESGVPLDKAEYLAEVTSKTLRDMLGGSGRLPLFGERVKALNELGRMLTTQYSGHAVHMVEQAGKSAVTLARLLAAKLSSFRDVASYKGREVFFYKRAQIFASDLYGALNGKHWAGFGDMDKLTAFADYKLPQVLRHLGILKYDRTLSSQIDQHVLIEAGSTQEIEIRASTVWAVERLRQLLTKGGKPIWASQIDWMLWNLGQQDRYRARPYHKTLTVFY